MKISKIIILSATALSLAACGEHTHSFASEWTYDETNHWHAATCEHTDLKSDEAPHVWGEWSIKTPASHVTTGLKERECSVCHKVQQEAISPLEGHTFNKEVVDEKYLKSAADCENPAVYYKSCECGLASTTETFTYGQALGHNYGEWIVDTEPTLLAGGTEHKVCSRCGDVATESIEKLSVAGRTFVYGYFYIDSTNADKDEIDAAKVTEGFIGNDVEFIEFLYSKYGNDPGAAALSFTFNDDTTVVTLSITTIEISEDSPCSITGDFTIQTKIATFVCSKEYIKYCFYSISTNINAYYVFVDEGISPHVHTYSEDWSSDETLHWHQCECGEKSDKADHLDTNIDGKCDVCNHDMEVPGPTPTGGKVTKEEYAIAFENFYKETNYTTHYDLAMSGYVNEESYNMKTHESQTFKRDGLKIYLQELEDNEKEYGEEFFEKYYEENGIESEEDKLNAFNDFIKERKSLGYTILETGKDYVRSSIIYAPETNYGEYIENDSLFAYDYVYKDESLSFVRAKKFYNECCAIHDNESNVLLDLMNKNDIYDLLTYDEANEKYIITDLEKLKEFDVGNINFNPKEIKQANASIKFNEQKLVSIDAVFEYNNNATINVSLIIENRNSTNVNLPTNLFTCTHQDTSGLFGYWNSTYHYRYCRYCEEVLDYEEHNMIHDGKICIECGHSTKSDNAFHFDFGDEHINNHISYYADEKDGQIDYVDFDDMVWDYEKNALVPKGDDDCGLEILEEMNEYTDETNQCVTIYEYVYTVIDTKNDNSILKTISEKHYYADHGFYEEEEQDPEDPCKYILHYKCSKCGLETTEIEHRHELTETTYASGCAVITKKECANCDFEIEFNMNVHKDMVIDGKIEGDDGAYNCHCESCNEEFVYRFYEYEYKDEFAHIASLYSQDGNLIGYTLLEHEYDEDGVCTYCGFDKNKSEYTTEKIVIAYESMDYLYIIYNSDGSIKKFEYSYIYVVDWSDPSHVIGRSSLTDYNFRYDLNDNGDEATAYYTLKIYKGSEFIKEIVQY